MPHIVGSPRIAEILEEAGLAGARAVVCAERSEVQTLETALLVSELRPDIRVVVQLANAAVGAAVAEVTGPGSVLDTAALAAPSIVEACLGRVAHPIELGGTRFVATEVRVVKPGTLRTLFGALAPVGVVPADGSPTVACPGRDFKVFGATGYGARHPRGAGRGGDRRRGAPPGHRGALRPPPPAASGSGR